MRTPWSSFASSDQGYSWGTPGNWAKKTPQTVGNVQDPASQPQADPNGWETSSANKSSQAYQHSRQTEARRAQEKAGRQMWGASQSAAFGGPAANRMVSQMAGMGGQQQQPAAPAQQAPQAKAPQDTPWGANYRMEEERYNKAKAGWEQQVKDWEKQVNDFAGTLRDGDAAQWAEYEALKAKKPIFDEKAYFGGGDKAKYLSDQMARWNIASQANKLPGGAGNWQWA